MQLTLGTPIKTWPPARRLKASYPWPKPHPIKDAEYPVYWCSRPVGSIHRQQVLHAPHFCLAYKWSLYHQEGHAPLEGWKPNLREALQCIAHGLEQGLHRGDPFRL